jgi:hypothetical protein
VNVEAASAPSTSLATPQAISARSARGMALLAAPAAAVAAGLAAELLDFRALRYPLLLMMLAAVTVTALAIEQRGSRPRSSGAKQTLRAIALGIAAWSAAEVLYVLIHALRGEPFDAERFGPQWTQALGLIGVHAFVLGAPTGIAAAAIIRVRAWWLARA